MTAIPITKAKQNLDELVATVSRKHTRVKLCGKDTCAYLISQEELDGIIATAELSAIPGMLESIRKGHETPYEECVAEEDLDWNAV